VTADAFVTSIRIDATPDAVFPYLTSAELMVRWMGNWADLHPHPGGQFALDFEGVPIRGRYVEVEAPHRLVFTWGAPGSESVPPGSSTVEITLRPDGEGTLLELVHRDLPHDEQPRHGLGWDHYLPRLALAAPGGDPGVDTWPSASEPGRGDDP